MWRKEPPTTRPRRRNWRRNGGRILHLIRILGRGEIFATMRVFCHDVVLEVVLLFNNIFMLFISSRKKLCTGQRVYTTLHPQVSAGAETLLDCDR